MPLPSARKGQEGTLKGKGNQKLQANPLATTTMQFTENLEALMEEDK
jgi:hypothetical protein